jgi:phosphoribosylamine-glycine ligase
MTTNIRGEEFNVIDIDGGVTISHPVYCLCGSGKNMEEAEQNLYKFMEEIQAKNAYSFTEQGRAMRKFIQKCLNLT